MDYHALLQGIFPTQGLNPALQMDSLSSKPQYYTSDIKMQNMSLVVFACNANYLLLTMPLSHMILLSVKEKFYTDHERCFFFFAPSFQMLYSLIRSFCYLCLVHEETESLEGLNELSKVTHLGYKRARIDLSC